MGRKIFSDRFARCLIESPFGDIYARPGRDLRAREIATAGALTVLSCAPQHLKVYNGGRAESTCSVPREEIAEARVSCGIEWTVRAKEVFAHRDEAQSNATGWEPVQL